MVYREIDIVTDWQLSFLFQPILFYLNNEMHNFRNAEKKQKSHILESKFCKIQRNIYISNE